jgi:hypothetical protein
MIHKNRKFILIIIGLLSIIVVFFIPFGYHIDLGPGPDSILAMIWEVPLQPAWYSIRYFSAFMYRLEYCFFRFFFILEIILLIIGKFNQIRFLLVGVISELIPLIISIPATFILNEQGDNLIAIVWPLPFLLIFDLTIIFLVKNLELNNPIKKI